MRPFVSTFRIDQKRKSTRLWLEWLAFLFALVLGPGSLFCQVQSQTLDPPFARRGNLPSANSGVENPNTIQSSNAFQSSNERIDRIELEVVFDPRTAPRDGAQWAQLLSEVGFDRAILRKATGQDEIGIVRKDLNGNIHLLVTGGLLRDRLLLPGLEARIVDKNLIAQWLRDLRNPPEVDATSAPFGLTDEEIVTVQQLLATAVEVSTAQQKPGETLEVLQTTSPILLLPTLQSSAAMTQDAKSNERTLHELKGLSVGTALAAFARPFGLVLVPGKSASGSLQLSLVKSNDPPEYWPVGWPTRKALIDLAPSMVQQTDVDFRGQTLSEAFRLISLKTRVPILLDYNSLLANKIDPDQTITQVAIRGKTWRNAMTAIATERRPSLLIEARIDDAGHPFFWISRP